MLVGAVAGVTLAAVLGGVGFFIGAAFFLAIGKAACGGGKAGGTGGERAFEQGAFGGVACGRAGGVAAESGGGKYRLGG